VVLELWFRSTILEEKGAKGYFCKMSLVGVEGIHLFDGIPISCLQVDG
jgi:hypothetical protein